MEYTVLISRAGAVGNLDPLGNDVGVERGGEFFYEQVFVGGGREARGRICGGGRGGRSGVEVTHPRQVRRVQDWAQVVVLKVLLYSTVLIRGRHFWLGFSSRLEQKF